MRSFLSLFFCFLFSIPTIGQHYGNLDYEALVDQILKDIPLENFKNEPTFLRVAYARSGCTSYDERDDHNYQTKETETRKHFLSPKNLARLQHEIQTALIPYFEAESMDRIIAFHGDPLFKRWPVIMPTFKSISHEKLTYFNTKKAFGYFPYKNKAVNINIQKHSLKDYIEQANHIKLEFIHKQDNSVLITGAVNRKKVMLLYQWIYDKWEQVPEFQISDITHYNHEGELFIKHNNITFEYEKEFELDDAAIASQTSIAPVHKESFQKENLISIDSIVTSNFSDFRNIKFTHENKDKSEKYEFFQFNSELFALASYYRQDDSWTFSEITFYSYAPISITRNKRIYRLFGEDIGVIIPEKNGIRIFLNKAQNLYNIHDFSTGERQKHYRNYDTEILAHIANNLDFEQYYKVKEEKEGKWMYNYLGLRKLDNVYDSIFVNNFIVGIKDGRYDIYNQALQKLPLKYVRAFHLINTTTTEGSSYTPHSAQIIHNNTLKTIYLSLKEDKKSSFDAYTLYGLPNLEKTTYKIIKKDDHVYIANIHEDLPKAILFKYPIPILEKQVDSIYFLGNKKQEISYTPIQLRYGIDLNEIIHVKTKHGTHYLYHTSYLNESISPFIKTALEEVEVYADCIRFKENNLYGYYGIHSKGRFATLEAFQGFFARFELPNGQKGWLDRNGKEYLDI